MADFMAPIAPDPTKPADLPKLTIPKAPVVGAAKGLKGLAGNSPWTQAQLGAGMRREIPLGAATGALGTNRVGPPPPIPYMPNRNNLAQMLAGSGGRSGSSAYDFTGAGRGAGTFGQPGMGGYSLPAGWSPAGTTQGSMPSWLSGIMPGWATGGQTLGNNPGWGYNPQGYRSSATGAGGSHGVSSGGYTTSGRGW
jgi:hypothetical protein